MAIRTPVYQPTKSQMASAAMHLARRDEWRTIRLDDVRYVVLLSGRTNHVYMVRASADGCSCPWYANTLDQCSHQLAVYLAATEDELIESAPRKTIEELMPAECDVKSCTSDAEPKQPGDEGAYCGRHQLAEVF